MSPLYQNPSILSRMSPNIEQVLRLIASVPVLRSISKSNIRVKIESSGGLRVTWCKQVEQRQSVARKKPANRKSFSSCFSARIHLTADNWQLDEDFLWVLSFEFDFHPSVPEKCPLLVLVSYPIRFARRLSSCLSFQIVLIQHLFLLQSLKWGTLLLRLLQCQWVMLAVVVATHHQLTALQSRSPSCSGSIWRWIYNYSGSAEFTPPPPSVCSWCARPEKCGGRIQPGRKVHWHHKEGSPWPPDEDAGPTQVQRQLEEAPVSEIIILVNHIHPTWKCFSFLDHASIGMGKYLVDRGIVYAFVKQ